ncbi:MAG TPA: AarF/UbiB family protein, partial [Blastocatellia bacterium]|nr:AarF/UbiB family protein [Blastocatellia bacterium]
MQEHEANSMTAAPADSRPALISAAPPARVTSAQANPDNHHERIGVRGYLRMLRIIVSFALFGLRVFLNSRDWLGRRRDKTAAQLREEGAILREKFLRLGPTFIKTGQTLATRADLLPVEYIQELSALQDEVPPFPAQTAREIIEAELGVKLDDLFNRFEDRPIAAASLGQVHRGQLRTGQTVAVKVQRPNLEARIEFDLRVLRRIARFAARYPNLVRGVDWQGTIDEFGAHIYEEMDYGAEVRNAEAFRRNFAKWPNVYVPRIF